MELIYLTSCEFGEVAVGNVATPSGGLGTGLRRLRFEIRRAGATFDIYLITRSYPPGREPRDVHEERCKEAANLGDAVRFVEQFIDSYADAQSDDLAAAEEAAYESHDDEDHDDESA